MSKKKSYENRPSGYIEKHREKMKLRGKRIQKERKEFYALIFGGDKK